MMAVSLPKVAAERVIETGEFRAFAGMHIPGDATFLDVHASGQIESFGPHVVYGGTAMTGFTVRTIVSEPRSVP